MSPRLPGDKTLSPIKRLLVFSIVILLAIWNLRTMQGTVPYSDDLKLILQSDGLFHDLFQVKIGWFAPGQRLIWNFLSSNFGLRTYFPYRFISVLLVSVAAAMIGIRFARHHLFLGCIAVVWVWTIPSAFHTYFWPAASWTMAGLIFLMVYQDRSLASFQKQGAWSMILHVSTAAILLSFSGPMGVPFLIGASYQSLKRKRHIHSISLLAPIFVYALIVLLFSQGDEPTPLISNLFKSSKYVFDSIVNSCASLFGLSNASGFSILIAIFAIFLLVVPRMEEDAKLSVKTWVITLLSFWALLALTRSHLPEEANAPRYAIVGAFGLIVILLECFISIDTRNTVKANFGLFLLTLVCLSNWYSADLLSNNFQYLSQQTRLKLTTVALIGDALPENHQFDILNYPLVSSQQYVDAIPDKGSLSLSENEIQLLSAVDRAWLEEQLLSFGQWTVGDQNKGESSCSTYFWIDADQEASKLVLIRNESAGSKELKIQGISGDLLSSFLINGHDTVELKWSGTDAAAALFSLSGEELEMCIFS